MMPATAPAPDDPVRPRSRRGLVVALVASGSAFVLMLALAGYLYWTTVEWQREAETLASDNTTLEQQLAGLAAELDDTRDELEVANDRLRELAGEYAQTTDERELLRQMADRNAELADENATLAAQQNEIAMAAAGAAAQLSECAGGQNQLLQVLINGGEPEQSLLDEVNRDCQSAQQARDALVRLLEG